MDTRLSIGLGGIVIGILLAIFLLPFSNGRMGEGVGMRSDIDQHFIEQMIPHHEGAIAMAELALQRTTREEVRVLSQDIIDAQTAEIQDMTSWYKEWFGREPSARGHGMMHMQGMEGDLTLLQAAADFDKEFLSQMIVHHEMAVMMAQMLDAGTSRPEMKQLASQIISSQTNEIETMEEWLQTW